jgi:hypothetical protein
MALLTLFSAPKPFTDPHIATIQRNALGAWLQLPDVEVILIGDEPGLAETASEFGVRYIAEVARNDWGTPLVSSIFALARQVSKSPLLAYTNADMLYTSDFVASVTSVARQADEFLVIGQRWDVDIKEPLAIKPGWEVELRQYVKANGRLHSPQGSDYFIFPRHVYTDIPDFAIGRAGWDNWMIYHARRKYWPVIDATDAIMAVHQNHDYAHLPGGQPHYDLEESRINAALAGGMGNLLNILDANAILVNGMIQPAPFSLVRLVRRIELLVTPLDEQRQGVRWWLARRIRRLRRRLTRTR